MALVDSALPKLQRVLQEAHEVVQQLRVSNSQAQHLVAAALLGTTLEEAQAIAASLKRNDATNAFILLRSLLEAFVDLINIVDDPNYVHFMHAAVLDQQRRIIESAQKRGNANPFLGNLGTHKDAVSHLAWVKNELATLKTRGVEPLSVKKRFERAKQLDYYEGPYANLCWYSHNNLHVLETRHLRQGAAGFEIVVFDTLSDEDATIIVDTTAGITANSVAALKGLLEGGTPSGLERLTAAVSNLRTLWHGST